LVNSWAQAKGPITMMMRARRAAVFISSVYFSVHTSVNADERVRLWKKSLAGRRPAPRGK
jgi:hypothetical protein